MPLTTICERTIDTVFGFPTSAAREGRQALDTRFVMFNTKIELFASWPQFVQNDGLSWVFIGTCLWPLTAVTWDRVVMEIPLEFRRRFLVCPSYNSLTFSLAALRSRAISIHSYKFFENSESGIEDGDVLSLWKTVREDAVLWIWIKNLWSFLKFSSAKSSRVTSLLVIRTIILSFWRKVKNQHRKAIIRILLILRKRRRTSISHRRRSVASARPESEGRSCGVELPPAPKVSGFPGDVWAPAGLFGSCVCVVWDFFKNRPGKGSKLQSSAPEANAAFAGPQGREALIPHERMIAEIFSLFAELGSDQN